MSKAIAWLRAREKTEGGLRWETDMGRRRCYAEVIGTSARPVLRICGGEIDGEVELGGEHAVRLARWILDIFAMTETYGSEGPK